MELLYLLGVSPVNTNIRPKIVRQEKTVHAMYSLLSFIMYLCRTDSYLSACV